MSLKPSLSAIFREIATLLVPSIILPHFFSSPLPPKNVFATFSSRLKRLNNNMANGHRYIYIYILHLLSLRSFLITYTACARACFTLIRFPFSSFKSLTSSVERTSLNIVAQQIFNNLLYVIGVLFPKSSVSICKFLYCYA